MNPFIKQKMEKVIVVCPCRGGGLLLSVGVAKKLYRFGACGLAALLSCLNQDPVAIRVLSHRLRYYWFVPLRGPTGKSLETEFVRTPLGPLYLPLAVAGRLRADRFAIESGDPPHKRFSG